MANSASKNSAGVTADIWLQRGGFKKWRITGLEYSVDHSETSTREFLTNAVASSERFRTSVDLIHPVESLEDSVEKPDLISAGFALRDATCIHSPGRSTSSEQCDLANQVHTSSPDMSPVFKRSCRRARTIDSDEEELPPLPSPEDSSVVKTPVKGVCRNKNRRNRLHKV